MPSSQGLLLLPEPWRFQRLPGECVLQGHVTVVSSSEGGASDAAAELLAGELRARGLSASSSSSSSSPSFGSVPPPAAVAVSVTVAPGAAPSLSSHPLGASEGYEIEVTPSALAIRAAGPAGAFYAVQTFGQLLPPPRFGQRRRRRRPRLDPEPRAPPPSPLASLAIPCLEVADAPRFAWRGLLLDVARHFFPARFVVDLVRAIASFKLNVLHLHLVDDQGWRLPAPPRRRRRRGEPRRRRRRRRKRGGSDGGSASAAAAAAAVGGGSCPSLSPSLPFLLGLLPSDL